MKAWNVTEEQIREAAASVGLALHSDWQGNGITPDGRALRFRLSVDSNAQRDVDGFLPYQRASTGTYARRRRVAAVCWHGHRDFMRALFALAPEMRLKTALANYRGREDFERTFEDTFGESNGYHLSYGEACNCSDAVRADAPTRLEYLRGELRAERISWGELAELQGLAPYIAPDDVELLEAAGVPEVHA